MYSAYFFNVLRIFGSTKLNVCYVFGKEYMQVRLFHKVFGIHKNVLHMYELVRNAARARLCAKRQTNDGTIVVAIFEQGHIENLFQRFELIFELFYVACVVFKIEDGYVTTLLLRETLIRVHESDLVTA